MEYRFLIYISYSYALPIGEPLEKAILKRDHTVNWFSDLNEGAEALNNKANVLHTIQAVLNYKPHIILTITDSVPDFINALKVQVFHGFNAQKRPSTKNEFSHFRLRGFFDLYCTQGPSTTSKFLEQRQKNPHFDVVETGWSKVDPFFPLETNQFNENPTVFIASTFTKRLSLAHNTSILNKIRELSQSGNYYFKMVLHPKIPIEIINNWKALENDYFSFYDTTNLIPLMKQADIMFSDTTSAIQEFLIQSKPVVAFNHTFKHDYLIHVNDPNKIESAFQDALQPSLSLKANMSKFIKELHPYSDGKSSERIVDASITFLHKDKSYLKSKPLNLVRKYKMRKRLNYFTFRSFNKAFTV